MLKERVKESIPTLAFYIVLGGLAYYIIPRIEILKDFTISISALIVFAILGEVAQIISGKRYAKYLALVFGIQFFVYYLPITLFPKFELSLLSLGVGLALIAPKLPDFLSFPVRGAGIAIVFYSLMELLPPLSEAFKIALLFAIPAYILASLEELKILGGDFFRRNILGFILVGLLLGIYYIEIPGVTEFISFIIKLSSLFLALAISAYIALSLPSKKSKEEVIFGELEHEVEILTSGDELLQKAEELVKEFVFRGDKLGILAYIALNAAKAGIKEDTLKEILRPIVEYERRRYSALAPRWWIRKMEKREIERRKKIIEEILRRIDKNVS